MEKHTAKPKSEWTEGDYDIWRVGYEDGLARNERDNEAALNIGRAIIAELDKRYEFAKEDY